MYYISVGYPIGVKGMDFVVEVGNSNITVPGNEAFVWLSYQGLNSSDDDNEIVRQLVHYGILCCADTYDLLYKKISTLRPRRQGCGSVDGNKHAIYLHEKIFHPTELQNNIWKLSNPVRSIADIMMLLKASDESLTFEKFLKNIGTLMAEGLMLMV